MRTSEIEREILCGVLALQGQGEALDQLRRGLMRDAAADIHLRNWAFAPLEAAFPRYPKLYPRDVRHTPEDDGASCPGLDPGMNLVAYVTEGAAGRGLSAEGYAALRLAEGAVAGWMVEQGGPAGVVVTVVPILHVATCGHCGKQGVREALKGALVLPTGRVLTRESLAAGKGGV